MLCIFSGATMFSSKACWLMAMLLFIGWPIQLCFLHIHKLHMNDNKRYIEFWFPWKVIAATYFYCWIYFSTNLSYKSTNALSSTNIELFQWAVFIVRVWKPAFKSPLAAKLGLDFISVFLLFYPSKCYFLKEAFSDTAD